MINERIDPPELFALPGLANVTVATGSRIVHLSGQTGVDGEGNVAGSNHLDQARRALQNLRVALEAAKVTLADVAKINMYVVDYSDAAMEAIITAAGEVFGDEYPITAATLIGVATLWQPDILIEIDAVAVA
jgi:enamine deaminase RidA (YjgF/YER057c/UK114 family)